MIEVTKEQREELRAALVADLRSGLHAQGRAHLCIDGKFCCLGRACEVALKFYPDIVQKTVCDSGDNAILYNGKDNILPDAVKNIFGFSSCGGGWGDTPKSSLWRKNDREELTFHQIADIIESRPPGLFVD